MKTLVVGEQPNGRRGGDWDPTGNSTRRLAKAFNMDPYYMRHSFTFDNLLPGHVAWDDGTAMAMAEAVLWCRVSDYDYVLLMGRRVAAACGMGDAPYLRRFRFGKTTFVVVPHPSGMNRWWNDLDNRRRGYTFLRRLRREISA